MSSRLVNGVRKDGTLIPLLLSSSEVTIGSDLAYILLLEQVHPKAVVFTCSDDGTIESVSQSVESMLGLKATTLCGSLVSSICEDKEMDPILMSMKCGTAKRFGPVSSFFSLFGCLFLSLSSFFLFFLFFLLLAG